MSKSPNTDKTVKLMNAIGKGIIQKSRAGQLATKAKQDKRTKPARTVKTRGAVKKARVSKARTARATHFVGM